MLYLVCTAICPFTTHNVDLLLSSTQGLLLRRTSDYRYYR
jgi:hypothetical protein